VTTNWRIDVDLMRLRSMRPSRKSKDWRPVKVEPLDVAHLREVWGRNVRWLL
jgi:hypothetical protein